MRPVATTRRQASIWTNPTLIGAVTVLVVLLAVFLAYTSSNGLPFVPTRELKVDFANADELVVGNEVREGGYRIGVVASMRPVRLASGAVVAQAILHLDKSVPPFPVDTTAVIRPQSLLGLEYLELDRGSAAAIVDDGGTLPVSQSRPEVELDQVIDTFDAPTRAAQETNLFEFGTAFAGRGADLSQTLQTLPPTLSTLTDVAANLASPVTDLTNLIRQLGVTAGVLAPVAPALADGFGAGATMFAAIDRYPAALEQTITQVPGNARRGHRVAAGADPVPHGPRRARAQPRAGRGRAARRAADPQPGARHRHPR